MKTFSAKTDVGVHRELLRYFVHFLESSDLGRLLYPIPAFGYNWASGQDLARFPQISRAKYLSVFIDISIALKSSSRLSAIP